MLEGIINLVVALLQNLPLLAAGAGCLLAQTIKVFYYWFKDKKVDLGHLLEAGGMPSAHSASVTALTLVVGAVEGFASSWFAIALVFSLIVMYDATGVRRAAGMQALILNRIVEDIYNTKKVNWEKLRELIGHTPLEVLMGVVVGVFTAIGFVLVL